MSFKTPWLALAAASGACAAFNGVFAKLYILYLIPKPMVHKLMQHENVYTQLISFPSNSSTTTSLTSAWSSAIASFFGLAPTNRFIEFSIRAV